jgi:hypothetical protein
MSNDDEVRIDRALLDRVAARDASAIAALYDRHSRLLFGLICGSCAIAARPRRYCRRSSSARGRGSRPTTPRSDRPRRGSSGGRRLVAGDFHHAEGGSDHGELFTEEGCRVLLVVPPEDYLPPVAG